MNFNKVFGLTDGRCLGYAEYGDLAGFPVLFCHGSPGSRWQAHPSMAGAAMKSGIRVIVPERPSYGLSDPQPGRSILDWPKDVLALMNSLRVDRFSIVGYSMGGVYALACGYALPSQVKNIALAGSLAPNVFQPEAWRRLASAMTEIYMTARDRPDDLHGLLQSLTPQQLLAAMAEPLPPADKAVLARPEISDGLLRDCEESLRNGGEGMVRDFMLTVRDWGFSLEEIQPGVSIWQGAEDINAPPAMAEYLAERLPNCSVHMLPEEGHLCFFTHCEEILLGIK